MPDPNLLFKEILGFRVARAADTLPQTAQEAIFTVSGGRVMIMALVGEITTVMGATASNLSVVFNPTVGADIALSAVVATANDAVGVHYSLPSAFATALVKGNAVPLPANPVMVSEGTLDLLTSGSNSGAVAWTIFYIPLDAGARVSAAA